MRFWNSSQPAFHHSVRTISLRTTSSSSTTTSTTIALSDFCAPLIPPYYGNPLLFNGHLQTGWTTTKFYDPWKIHYARRHFSNPNDGGSFAVDFVVDSFDPETSASDLPPCTRHMESAEAEELGDPSDDRPMLVVLHGLSGGSHEVYLRAVLSVLFASDERWTACVVNARGCALSKITTRHLFNARFTTDLRQTVQYLRKVYPQRPLYGIGFSLGANILTNYLGEEGESCVLRAAVVCSNPWQLYVSYKALLRTWIGREVYSKVMGASMRQLFELHVDEISKDDRVDVEQIRKGSYLFEFDRDLTAKVFGYATVGAYYRDSSSVDNLLKVRIPVLVVHAKDDPIAVDEAVPYDEVMANPYIFMTVTEGGGHLSWFEWGGGRWFTKPIANFLTKFANDVVEVVPNVVEDTMVKTPNESTEKNSEPGSDESVAH